MAKISPNAEFGSNVEGKKLIVFDVGVDEDELNMGVLRFFQFLWLGGHKSQDRIEPQKEV